MSVLVTFLTYVTKELTKMKDRRVSFGSQIEGTVSPGRDCHGKSGMRQLVTSHLQSGERER